MSFSVKVPALRKEKFSRTSLLAPILLIIAVVFSRGCTVYAGFMNDDIQIIGVERAESFIEIFSPFYSLNVWDIYWRPLTAFLHKLQLFLFGLNAVIFRTTTLLLFLLSALLVYKLAIRTGLGNTGALIATLLLSLAPSKELNAAWISANGDGLAMIFLIMSLLGWMDSFKSDKHPVGKLSVYIFFLFALLSKELSYAGVLIPLLALFLSDIRTPESIRKAILGVSINLVLVIVLIFYRYIVIGSNLFAAPHIQDLSLVRVLMNFGLYIPGSFISPEIMEEWYFNFFDPLNLLIIILILSVIGLTIYRWYKSQFMPEWKSVLFGVAWFILFILPVTPVYMRWYPYIASAGLIIAIGHFLEKPYKESKFLTTVVVIIGVILLIYDIGRSESWIKAGNLYAKQLEFIKADYPLVNPNDTLYLIAVPDKAERVGVMKLGINESVEYAIGRKIPNRVILRCELQNAYEKIKINKDERGFLSLELNNSRFILPGMPSAAIIRNEKAGYEDDFFRIQVNTFMVKAGGSVSKAEIEFKSPELRRQAIVLCK